MMTAKAWPGYQLAMVASTQDEARRLAETASGIFTVSARAQDAGRGQYGRSWTSPPGANILTTIAVPAAMVREPELLSLQVGCAVADAISAYLSDVRCRWPNDIYSGDKKISGILIEYSSAWYFIGIGCNVNWPCAESAEQKQGWTSIAAEHGSRHNCSDISAEIYQACARRLASSPEEILCAYRAYWKEKNCRAQVVQHDTWKSCRLSNVNRDGTLSVVDDNGNVITITSSATLRRRT